LKLVLEQQAVDTTTKPVKYLQVFLQVAFDLGMLYIASEAYIYIWRITTGH